MAVWLVSQSSIVDGLFSTPSENLSPATTGMTPAVPLLTPPDQGRLSDQSALANTPEPESPTDNLFGRLRRRYFRRAAASID